MAGAASHLQQIKVVLPALGRIGSNFDMRSVTDDQVAALGDVMFAALSKGTPTLKRDAFEDLHITPAEIAAAVPVIIRQSGFSSETGGSAGTNGGSGSGPVDWDRVLIRIARSTGWGIREIEDELTGAMLKAWAQDLRGAPPGPHPRRRVPWLQG